MGLEWNLWSKKSIDEEWLKKNESKEMLSGNGEKEAKIRTIEAIDKQIDELEL